MKTLLENLPFMKKLVTALTLLAAFISHAQTYLDENYLFTQSFWTSSYDNPKRVFNGINLYGGTNQFFDSVIPTSIARDSEVAAAVESLATTNFVIETANKKAFVLTNTVVASDTNYTTLGGIESGLVENDVIRLTASGFCNGTATGVKMNFRGGGSVLGFNLSTNSGYWRFSGTITARPNGFSFEGIVNVGEKTIIQSGVTFDDISALNEFSLSARTVGVSSDYIDCSTLLIEKL